jgi:myo-inositol-1(or 4)-monophosphatase
MTEEELDLAALLAAARTAALEGGDVLTRYFGAAPDARAKAPGDWVSEADLASERAVKASLSSAAPEIPFFGEETGGEHGRRGWYVDPLDGTANYLHGFDAVAVSIALVDDDRPVVGVVHAPLLGRTFCAVAGGGAWRDDTPIHVSTRAVSESICATGFPFRRKHVMADRYLAVFTRAFATFEDLRRVGAASLDLCWVAEGVFEGFFELSLGTWDVAAGGLIVREAGGVVTDWEGDHGAWLRSGDVLAAPPAVHEVLLEVVAVAEKRD